MGLAGNLLNFLFTNQIFLCWKYNLCEICIFQIESDEEIITNELTLPSHVLSIFPVQVTSWLWSGRNLFTIWYILQLYPQLLNTFKQRGKIETPRVVTVLLKQRIVSAAKNILFYSRLTLLTPRHLREKNVWTYA